MFLISENKEKYQNFSVKKQTNKKQNNKKHTHTQKKQNKTKENPPVALRWDNGMEI